jgi:serine/threonine-protein kinase
VIAASTPAAADPATAEALFQEGRALLDRGELEAACAKFESSQASEPSGGTLLNLADCRARQGRTATAWAHFIAAERLSRVQGRPEQAAEAQRRRAELEPSLSTLTLHAADTPPGLEAKVNGRSFDAGSFDSRLPMDPGGLSIEFSAPGRKPARVAAVLMSKGHHLVIHVPELGPAVAPAAPVAQPAAPSPVSHPGRVEPDGGSRTLAWVIGGASVAALAVGGTFGVMALSSNSDAEDACNQRNDECPPEALAAAKDRDRDATVATIGVGTGLAGLGVATILFLTSSPPDHSARPQGLSLHIAPGLTLISGTARF